MLRACRTTPWVAARRESGRSLVAARRKSGRSLFPHLVLFLVADAAIVGAVSRHDLSQQLIIGGTNSRFPQVRTI